MPARVKQLTCFALCTTASVWKFSHGVRLPFSKGKEDWGIEGSNAPSWGFEGSNAPFTSLLIALWLSNEVACHSSLHSSLYGINNVKSRGMWLLIYPQINQQSKKVNAKNCINFRSFVRLVGQPTRRTGRGIWFEWTRKTIFPSGSCPQTSLYNSWSGLYKLLT